MSDARTFDNSELSSEDVIQANQAHDVETSTNAARAKRVVSSIEFPYNSLESSIDVARRIYEAMGRSAAAPDKVAALLDSTVTSGTYKLRMSAARMFGLIGGERGAIRITELAEGVLDPDTAGQARATAFLEVELYRKIYEQNRGRLLPKAAGLEAEMVALGVAPKQSGRARQVFERSAKEAGFFEHGADRLVEPTFNGAPVSAILSEPPEAEPAPARADTRAAQSKVSAVADDPLVQGLLSRMPAPERGWPSAERARWLQTFAMNLELIYGADEAAITVAERRSGEDA